MNSLLSGVVPVRRNTVRSFLLSLLIAISVLCAGWDARAEAHDFSAHDHALEVAGDLSDHGGAAGDLSDQGSEAPADPAMDPAHHHHCPLATTPADSRAHDRIPDKTGRFRPGNGKVLASDDIAPPLEPPLT